MVWLIEHEPLINAVIDNKLKVLTSLTKMVRGRKSRLEVLLTQTERPPAERRGLTHVRYLCGTW
jgi:hypothetical protein